MRLVSIDNFCRSKQPFTMVFPPVADILGDTSCLMDCNLYILSKTRSESTLLLLYINHLPWTLPNEWSHHVRQWEWRNYVKSTKGAGLGKIQVLFPHSSISKLAFFKSNWQETKVLAPQNFACSRVHNKVNSSNLFQIRKASKARSPNACMQKEWWYNWLCLFLVSFNIWAVKKLLSCKNSPIEPQKRSGWWQFPFRSLGRKPWRVLNVLGLERKEEPSRINHS